jgi:hypothetical protein
MNDELPEVFRDVAPRGAPAELRAKTLAAVGRELSRRRKPRWERIVELSVAASLALGIGLNVWLVRSDEAWHARVVGVPGLPSGAAGRDLAAAGQSLGERLLSVWSGGYGASSATVKHYQQLLHELKSEKRPSSL